MKNFTLLCVFSLAALFAWAQPVKTALNVTAYGAKGDGKTIDTKSINKAIETAATQGGGTVYFPAGDYLTGSIHLQSNVSLYIDQGATIIAAEPLAEAVYDEPEETTDNKYEDFGHRHWHNSLIWGERLHDISILGPGKIWGRGLVRANKEGEHEKAPNKSIALYMCRNVIIRDVSIQHGGWFAILATGVDNFTIDNVKMDTNRDGMDIDCCQNVRISNCSVNSPYDDGICLKSSYGLNTNRACENITITNCQVSGFDEGSFFDGTYKRTNKSNTGRIKFGTESNGGFKNITISNCVFVFCRGLALETVDGALLEDVTINNITMRDVVNPPIFIRLGERMRGPAGDPVGQCRRVIISNIISYNNDATFGALITGVPGHDIEDLTLSNIRIYYKGGGTAGQRNKPLPELEKEYPEPRIFKETPAYGFFVRHVKGLKMRDIELSYLQPDQRPAFIFDDVKGADIQMVHAQKEDGVPTMVLNNVADLNLYNNVGIANMKAAKVTSKEIR